jgi:hypothetical protein
MESGCRIDEPFFIGGGYGNRWPLIGPFYRNKSKQQEMLSYVKRSALWIRRLVCTYDCTRKETLISITYILIRFNDWKIELRTGEHQIEYRLIWNSCSVVL